MAANDYHFITRWRLPATIDEVADILADAEDLVRWWPSVYLKVTVVEEGEPSGLGRVVDLHTKGRLPYTLNWSMRVTDVNLPHGFAIEAWGDFVGRGIWTLTQDGDVADVVHDWKIRADKPLLRTFSPLLKPLFSWNHHWAMSQGEESILREIDRRRQLDGISAEGSALSE